jgi:RecB family exonuclease
VSGQELRLRGRIDRLEWSLDDSFRVIDYKSGTNRQQGVFAGGKALQLAIYLLAGADIVGLDVERGTARYSFATRRGAFSEQVLTGTDLVAARDRFEEVLARIVGGVEGGDFHAQPDRRECEWCDFDAVCDVGRYRQAERKQDDERRITFAQMREIT